MAKLKGASFGVVRTLIKEQGKEFEEKYYAALTPEERDYVQNAMAVSWVELEMDENKSALAILAKMLYPNDSKAVRKISHVMAVRTVPKVYQIFIRIPTIEFVYQRAAKIWSSYYDKGQLCIENFKETGMEAILRDYPEYPLFLRDAVTGFFEGIGELLKLKNFRIFKIEKDPNAWKWICQWEK